MGAPLFEAFPELTAQADDILGYSLKDLCLNDSANQLIDTRYTQPALFVVNALTYLHKLRQDSTRPAYVVGHSLGEYNALFAAGVFDFATGVQLVHKRGELMAQAPSGSMAAVLNCPAATVQQILQEHHLEGIDVATSMRPPNWCWPVYATISTGRKHCLTLTTSSTSPLTSAPLSILATCKRPWKSSDVSCRPSPSRRR